MERREFLRSLSAAGVLSMLDPAYLAAKEKLMSGETPAAPVFIDGKKAVTLRGENIAGEFEALVQNYVDTRFGDG